MSVYQFSPATTYHQVHDFVTWEDAFSEEELDKLQQYAKTLTFSKAAVSKEAPSAEFDGVRRSSVAWITNNDQTGWIYDRLAFVGRQINAKFFGFDLYGFLEDFQYTVYVEEEESHYTWHIDMSPTSPAQRKLSLVLQLSDPADYEGGDLQTMQKPEPSVVDKKRGLIAAFPSWTLHRVTPVTKGVRHSLVVWICGPAFK
jgi:PKHD-type hydroxylase